MRGEKKNPCYLPILVLPRVSVCEKERERQIKREGLYPTGCTGTPED